MNRLYLLLISLFLFFGCQNQEILTELNELKAQSELEQQNLALVEKFIIAWNSQDIDSFDEILDPQFKAYVPSTTEEPMSVDAYKEWMKGIIQGFPDIHYEIKDIFAAGNRVSLWWVLDATLPGSNPDGPDAGKKISGSAIEIYTVINGKIVEEKTEIDELGLQQQMGFKLVPSDAAGD